MKKKKQVKVAQKIKKIPVWRRALGIVLFIAIVNQLSQLGYGIGIVVAFIRLPLLAAVGQMAEAVGDLAGAAAGLLVSPIALLGKIFYSDNPAYGIGYTLGLIGMIILAVWLTWGFGKRETNAKRREL